MNYILIGSNLQLAKNFGAPEINMALLILAELYCELPVSDKNEALFQKIDKLIQRISDKGQKEKISI